MTIRAFDSAAFAHPPRSTAPISNWSQEQLVRLEYEWRRLQRSFAYHPHVRVVSSQDDPPDEYEIEFKVRTLCVGETGQLEYTDVVPLRIALPPAFPYAEPLVRPLKALFHPNISFEGIHLGGAWQPTDTLVEFIRRVGELLAWRAYDPQTVVSGVALQWLETNANLLPTDPEADFSADAGGEPVERIARHGGATLAQIRQQLQQVRDSMLDAEAAPGLPEVREFSRHTRQTLNLFMDADVPDALRGEAAGLEEWAQELPGSVPAWESIRSRRAAAHAVRSAGAALFDKREPLLQQVKALEALAPGSPAKDATAAMAAVPARKAMEVVQLKLPSLVREAEELLQSLHERVAALDEVPSDVPVREESALALQLQAEMEAASASIRAAREAAADTMAAIGPVLETARAESVAVRQIGLWREFIDLFTTGRVLDQKLAQLGAAGVQAFQIENASGVFGPFQLDEPVDLEARRVAVRSTARNRVRLIDVPSTDVIGRSDTGSLVIDLAPAGSPEPQLTTFRLTERWEDLAVQLDFLVRQSGQLVVKLTVPPLHSASWCGAVLAVLGRPDAVQFVRQQHRKVSHRWRALLEDLQALGPVKARIETWNFVGRVGEVVPQLIAQRAGQQAALAGSERELASIVSRCKRDLDTDRLIIPPKLAGPYSEQTRLRDQSRREIGRLEKLLVNLGSQIARQLSTSAVVGEALVPQFRALPAFPPDLAELVSSMTDAALIDQVTQLESLLQMPLKGYGWQPSPEPAARPSEPEVPPALPAEPQDSRPPEEASDDAATDGEPPGESDAFAHEAEGSHEDADADHIEM